MAMRTQRLGSFLLTGVVALVGLGAANARERTDCDRRIANVAHDGIHFAVSISQDGKSLEIFAPEKSNVEPRPISIRLRFRDESAVEGIPERQGSVAGGGYTDWRYRFDAKRPLTISSIMSVRISVGDQSFEVFPW
jgi:hypothetical protein